MDCGSSSIHQAVISRQFSGVVVAAVVDCPALSSMSSSIRLVCGQAVVSGTKGWMSGYSGSGVLAG